MNDEFHQPKIQGSTSPFRGKAMPDAQRLLGEIAAGPEHVAIMGAALDQGWDHVARRFAGAPPEVVSAARTALANGIINAFRLGATDLIVLKHSGLGGLRLHYPDRFQVAAE